MQLYYYPLNQVTELCAIARNYPTDKCFVRKWHSYTEIYDHFLSNRRVSATNILEIGIGSPSSMGDDYFIGSSLFMWREYLQRAKIQAIDLDPKTMVRGEHRISTYVCDQVDQPALSQLFAGQEFDFIIDDGSHLPEHQVKSFAILSTYVKPFGFYFIEDVIADAIPYVMEGIANYLAEIPISNRPSVSLIRIRNKYYNNDFDDNIIVMAFGAQI